MTRSTTTKEKSAANPAKQGADEEDHTESDYRFDDKDVAELPRGWRKQTPFQDKVTFQWMRNERISVNYCDKKL